MTKINPFDLGTPEVPGHKTTNASTQDLPTDWEIELDRELGIIGKVITPHLPFLKAFIRNLLSQQKAQMIREIEGMKKVCGFRGEVTKCREHLDYSDHDIEEIAYNQALNDIIATLK